MMVELFCRRSLQRTGQIDAEQANRGLCMFKSQWWEWTDWSNTVIANMGQIQLVFWRILIRNLVEATPNVQLLSRLLNDFNYIRFQRAQMEIAITWILTSKIYVFAPLNFKLNKRCQGEPNILMNWARLIPCGLEMSPSNYHTIDINVQRRIPTLILTETVTSC